MDLFFDLIFVAAVAQVGKSLAADYGLHVDAAGFGAAYAGMRIVLVLQICEPAACRPLAT